MSVLMYPYIAMIIGYIKPAKGYTGNGIHVNFPMSEDIFVNDLKTMKARSTTYTKIEVYRKFHPDGGYVLTQIIDTSG